MELIGTAPGFITYRSQITAGTLGSGKSGDVTLNARRLSVRDGGAIRASTLGAGSGGNVTVTASESVEIVGTTRDGFPSVIITASGNLRAQTLLGLQPPSGAAGSLSIATAG